MEGGGAFSSPPHPSSTGLLVPTIKSCQNKSILDITNDLVRLHELGKQNQIGSEELSGGTFSLSNIGNIAGTYTSPVIMAPQVSIGAIGRIRTIAKYDEEEEEFFPSKVINVSWAADHRVIDGATMARFSNKFKNYIENPVLMLAGMK